MKHNRELDWASFNRSNVTDVVNHLTTKYETTEGIHVQAEATQLSQPFGNSNAKVRSCSNSGKRCVINSMACS